MGSKRCGVGKVDAVRSGRHIVICEQCSAINLKVRNELPARGKVPLQDQRAKSCSIGGIRRLKDEERGRRVQGVLEAAFQEPGPVWLCQNPSIAKPKVPKAGVLCPAGNRVSATRPQ